MGHLALSSNTVGGGNTAFGTGALFNNTTGLLNSAFGFAALTNLAIGGGNTASGEAAGFDLTSGDGNVYIGANVTGQASENNHTYIRNIETTTVSGGGTDTVTVDLTTGLLGHLSSSRRYKEDIKPMENASETLYRLNPVTYHYKKEIDRTQVLDYGLIAEDVAEIDPNLTVCNKQGQIESVRYNAINAMLLNEFLKEHRQVQQEKATIIQLKKEIQTVVAELKEQAAQIRQVTAKLETSRSATQVVMNAN